MKKQTIYEPVKAVDELPNRGQIVFLEGCREYKGTLVRRQYGEGSRVILLDSIGNVITDFIDGHKELDEIHWLKQSEKYVFDEDQFIDVVRALDLAQMELRALYKKTGTRGSNVLDIIDSVYDELFKDSVYDELSKGIPETNPEQIKS